MTQLHYLGQQIFWHEEVVFEKAHLLSRISKDQINHELLKNVMWNVSGQKGPNETSDTDNDG